MSTLCGAVPAVRSSSAVPAGGPEGCGGLTLNYSLVFPQRNGRQGRSSGAGVPMGSVMGREIWGWFIID